MREKSIVDVFVAFVLAIVLFVLVRYWREFVDYGSSVRESVKAGEVPAVNVEEAVRNFRNRITQIDAFGDVLDEPIEKIWPRNNQAPE